MKRLIISAFALSLLFTSYEKEANSLTPDAASENSEQNAVIKRKCHSAEILKKQLSQNPDLTQKMTTIKEQIKRFSKKTKSF